jgi:hypothetical protein
MRRTAPKGPEAPRKQTKMATTFTPLPNLRTELRLQICGAPSPLSHRFFTFDQPTAMIYDTVVLLLGFGWFLPQYLLMQAANIIQGKHRMPHEVRLCLSLHP